MIQGAASILAERERYQAQARAIGISATDISRMSALAEQIGPRTLLPNGEVWRAVWGTMLAYAKQGKPPIPDDQRAWAMGIWLFMFYRPPLPHEYGVFLSLQDAVK